MGTPVYLEREQQEPWPRGCGSCFRLENALEEVCLNSRLVSRVAYPNIAFCYLPYVELLC
jgi:hypothetical protein